MIETEVCEVRGRCPVYEVGDNITVDDPQIILEKTDALRTHAQSSLLHHVPVLEWGINPVGLGLSRLEGRKHAYIQCVDPGEHCSHGGTVIFKIGKTDVAGKRPERAARARGVAQR